MNPQQLWETTMDPSTRTLLRVSIEDAKKADKLINVLMGNEASIRKDWINENVEFISEDDFKINQKEA